MTAWHASWIVRDDGEVNLLVSPSVFRCFITFLVFTTGMNIGALIQILSLCFNIVSEVGFISDLVGDGFGEEPYFWVILAELTSHPPPSPAGIPPSASMDSVIGYALYFFTYFTLAGGRLLCLEDLYIRPDYRSKFWLYTVVLLQLVGRLIECGYNNIYASWNNWMELSCSMHIYNIIQCGSEVSDV